MSSFKLNREKYLNLLNSQGPTVALTTLQKDIIRWEYEAFEGEKGYQPAMWEELEKVREFSRELWNRSVLG